MQQPLGYEQRGPNGAQLYCRLEKSLYGLKQSARLWHKDVTKWLLEKGFTRSLWDPCLFIRTCKRGTLLCTLWVDDVPFNGPSVLKKEFVQEFLKTFEATYKGAIDRFLAMEIFQNTKKGLMVLTQTGYVLELLELYGLKDANPVDTPK